MFRKCFTIAYVFTDLPTCNRYPEELRTVIVQPFFIGQSSAFSDLTGHSSVIQRVGGGYKFATAARVHLSPT